MVQRQGCQQLLEAGDWTQTPVSGCKMRSRAPSSPLLWSPSPLHARDRVLPCRYATPHPRNFFFNTDSLLMLLLLPPDWARLEEGDAQLGDRGGLEKHLCFHFWPSSPENAACAWANAAATSWVLFINSCLAGFIPIGECGGEEGIFQHLFCLRHDGRTLKTVCWVGHLPTHWLCLGLQQLVTLSSQAKGIAEEELNLL